ncbi:thioredoxin domain-containing protein [Streptomyces sp. 549]|uniref:DsbA family protein n=1 Tax=Streptomyces sp. 549 TaxID=3049076 RepID=UPI0024C42E1D|nr:thioredoxin domain-containing protein [Streptomyces sp. 549]MDK1474127.1 thioredoxin domain-containing protein [Streptomyces sp. 549]
MSKRNTEGKRSARERLQDEREREKARAKRLRALKVGAVAFSVLAVAGVAGIVVTQQGKEKPSGPVAAPISEGKSGAPVTLTVYEDFRCPGCGHFERNFRETIQDLRDAGKIRSEYHLVSIIDGNMGGDGSKNAANAAACARDEGKFTEYHDVLFDNQPEEAADTFADKDHLVELAGKVDGLDTPSFRSCVQDGTHDAWVKRVNTDFTGSEYNATPTVLLDGENLYGDPNDPLTPEKLREKVERIAGN